MHRKPMAGSRSDVIDQAVSNIYAHVAATLESGDETAIQATYLRMCRIKLEIEALTLELENRQYAANF